MSIQTSFDWRELSINNLVQEVVGLTVTVPEESSVARKLARDLVALLKFADRQEIDLGHEFAVLVDEGNKVVQ